MGLVLSARLGSDGYSSLVNGVSRSSRMPYAIANWLIGLSAVAFAWRRGVRPGPGTVVHPMIVGITVNLVLIAVDPPTTLVPRVAVLLAGVGLLAVGVAGYLATALGSGPFESATIALRPVPFRIAYAVLQAAGAGIGWALGASIGVGTLVVVLGVGPLVSAIRTRLPGV
ncbi:MAG TPA: hypothetical protein VH373_02595 [Jatrophihabitantaceae bacterium]